jgi:hypothetical protein
MTAQTAQTAYKAATRDLERAQEVWHHLMITGTDKRTVKAALAIVDHYRGAQDAAFDAWRQTWDSANE